MKVTRNIYIRNDSHLLTKEHIADSYFFGEMLVKI